MNLQNYGKQLRDHLREIRLNEYAERVEAMTKAHEEALAKEESLMNAYLEQIDSALGFASEDIAISSDGHSRQKPAPK